MFVVCFKDDLDWPFMNQPSSRSNRPQYHSLWFLVSLILKLTIPLLLSVASRSFTSSAFFDRPLVPRDDGVAASVTLQVFVTTFLHVSTTQYHALAAEQMGVLAIAKRSVRGHVFHVPTGPIRIPRNFACFHENCCVQMLAWKVAGDIANLAMTPDHVRASQLKDQVFSDAEALVSIQDDISYGRGFTSSTDAYEAEVKPTTSVAVFLNWVSILTLSRPFQNIATNENGCLFSSDELLEDCQGVQGGAMQKGVHGAVQLYVALARRVAIDLATHFDSTTLQVPDTPKFNVSLSLPLVLSLSFSPVLISVLSSNPRLA